MQYAHSTPAMDARRHRIRISTTWVLSKDGDNSGEWAWNACPYRLPSAMRWGQGAKTPSPLPGVTSQSLGMKLVGAPNFEPVEANSSRAGCDLLLRMSIS